MIRRNMIIVLISLAMLIFSGFAVNTAAVRSGNDMYIRNYGFRIDLDSSTPDGFENTWRSIRGGGLRLHESTASTGKHTFKADYDDLILVGPMVPSDGGARKELLDWLNQWASGTGPRQNAELELLNDNERVVNKINFSECFPTSYQPPSVNAGNDTPLEERFSFKPMRVMSEISYKKPLGYEQSVEEQGLTGRVFNFEIDGKSLQLSSCSPGGMTILYEEAIGGDEPWENKPGLGQGSDWIGGDEPWDNKPGNGAGSDWIGGDEPWENKPGKGQGVNWIGGDEPWENKPGRGGGSEWIGGDEPWENKPGNGAGSDWIGGDEPWENKPGNGAGSDWIGGDEPWENKPGRGQGANWIGGDEPWENKPGRGGGADWIGGDEPWENKFNYMNFEVTGVEFDTWTITREYDRADTTLAEIYKAFASGMRTQNERDTGSLTYFDRAGNEARAINFFGYMPIKYETINVDSSDGSSVLIETMTFSVLRCEYN